MIMSYLTYKACETKVIKLFIIYLLLPLLPLRKCLNLFHLVDKLPKR